MRGSRKYKRMKYYPVNLNVKDKECLVVGAGEVGARKINTLLKCGADVFVVSEKVSDSVKKFSEKKLIKLAVKKYEKQDLDGKFLVIGAINDFDISEMISSDAKEKKVLCNIADSPSQSDFILPSIVNNKDLIIAVSTSGKSPAFAKKMRKELESKYGDEYAELLELMGAIREKLLAKEHEPEAHKHLFEKIINSDILNLIKKKDTAAINEILRSVLGEEYTI